MAELATHLQSRTPEYEHQGHFSDADGAIDWIVIELVVVFNKSFV